MKVSDLINIIPCEVVAGNSVDRQIDSVYCCDLLSVVMGRAPAGCAWFTVMGNLNAVAVSTLADTACVVIAEGMSVDKDALKKANSVDVVMLKTPLQIFEAAKLVDIALQNKKDV